MTVYFQARFILEKIKGNIVMENKKKRVIVDRLIELKFDPDPVKKWKEDQKKRVGLFLSLLLLHANQKHSYYTI